MKLSQSQVRSSLKDLRSHRPVREAAGHVCREPDAVPAGVRERIHDAPRIRSDAVANARAWLARGATPTGDELATAVVGRLISDRLR